MNSFYLIWNHNGIIAIELLYASLARHCGSAVAMLCAWEPTFHSLNIDFCLIKKSHWNWEKWNIQLNERPADDTLYCNSCFYRNELMCVWVCGTRWIYFCRHSHAHMWTHAIANARNHTHEYLASRNLRKIISAQIRAGSLIEWFRTDLFFFAPHIFRWIRSGCWTKAGSIAENKNVEYQIECITKCIFR